MQVETATRMRDPERNAPGPDRETHGGAGGALGRLATLVAEDLARVNAAIRDRLQSDVPLIPQLAGHLIEAGGKRLRPLLTLASARLCAEDRADGAAPLAAAPLAAAPLAAAVEFIHTATLLHDDVVDASQQRRGRPSANALWGNHPSVLVGDFLFARAFELMTEVGDLAVLRTLSRASCVIAEGEVLQLRTTGDLDTTVADCMAVVRAKTAELFAAACEVGGLVARDPRAPALRRFGMELGLAFQLADDVLDYRSTTERIGKTVGDDFREGKATLPVLLAYAAGDAADRAFWRRTIVAREQTEEDLAHAMALLAATGALDETLRRAEAHAADARAALSVFPPSPLRAALEDSATHAVTREA